MGYKERKKLYEEIEKERDRPLISYVTSLRTSTDPRVHVGGQMAPDVITDFQNK